MQFPLRVLLVRWMLESKVVVVVVTGVANFLCQHSRATAVGVVAVVGAADAAVAAVAVVVVFLQQHSYVYMQELCFQNPVVPLIYHRCYYHYCCLFFSTHPTVQWYHRLISQETVVHYCWLGCW